MDIILNIYVNFNSYRKYASSYYMIYNHNSVAHKFNQSLDIIRFK